MQMTFSRFGCAFVLAVSINGWSAEEKSPARVEYGIDPETGVFIHPENAPYAAYSGPRPVEGSLDYLDQEQYANNVSVLAHWDIMIRPGHTWQHVLDWEGRRFMYHYYRQRLNIYDITDPVNLQVVLEKTYEDGTWFGAARIAFHKGSGKWLMLQSFEVPRSIGGMMGRKYDDPSAAREIMQMPGLRGFRVFEMQSPTEWKLLREVSFDVLNPKAEVQQGSGALDVPTWDGGRYAYLLGAPDNTFVHMESPNQIYSAAHLIFDLENPLDPQLLSTWWVPGQRLGEEEAYRAWPQAGNRESWTGGRLPMVVPNAVEAGGRYAYTAVGALGFFVLDIADPSKPRTIGALQLPYGIGGHEGDNVDASRATSRGLVLVNGYPMNEDCYEPWKDVYLIDVSAPEHPNIVGTLPRPTPPAEAPFSDYCLRRAKFGPKRSTPVHSPGTPRENLVVYTYNNAGVQIFDISNPRAPQNVAYFVPPMGGDFNDPSSYNTPVESIFVEWDRNLIWAFTTSGMYLLSSPVLGEPQVRDDAP